MITETRTHRIAARACIATACLALLALGGCHHAASGTDAKASDSSHADAKPDAKEDAEGVTLTAEQSQKLGVTTVPAKAVEYSEEIAGFGVVTAHEAVATAVAELLTAQAAQDQSRAAATRAQRLVGTPGAMSADTVEAATRQVATDSAALALAQHRLSAVIGSGPPGGLTDPATLQDLASGKTKLLRASFPLGALPGATPATLRAARLDSAAPGWTLRPVWTAPADASLPGRSFFALLKGSDAGEGERLMVWAPGAGPAIAGVAVPTAAVVLSDGKYWCYVEQKPGEFARRPVATEHVSADGYVVTAGVAAGDKVVTAGAGLLLARELNPSTEAD